MQPRESLVGFLTHQRASNSGVHRSDTGDPNDFELAVGSSTAWYCSVVADSAMQAPAAIESRGTAAVFVLSQTNNIP